MTSAGGEPGEGVVASGAWAFQPVAVESRGVAPGAEPEGGEGGDAGAREQTLDGQRQIEVGPTSWTRSRDPGAGDVPQADVDFRSDLVAAGADRRSDPGAESRRRGVEASEGRGDDAGGDTAPAAVDDGKLLLPPDHEGHAVGGDDRERQPAAVGPQAVGAPVATRCRFDDGGRVHLFESRELEGGGGAERLEQEGALGDRLSADEADLQTRTAHRPAGAAAGARRIAHAANSSSGRLGFTSRLSSVIEFFQVSKRFADRVALEDLSFLVAEGEFAFINGPSGAGKTTLLKLIYRGELPSSGRILVNGRNVVSLPRKKVPYLRRSIGVVFQDFALIERRTVLENVSYLPRILGCDRRASRRLARQALERVELGGELDAYPSQLSGGEQQRVAIARALIGRPRILIADEPTGNLDPDLSREILNLFFEAQRDGTTVLLATHDPGLSPRPGDRVLQLAGGRLTGDFRVGGEPRASTLA